MDGLAEGRAEGVEIEKYETVKRLAVAGIDTSTISIATGLSSAVIENIIKKK